MELDAIYALWKREIIIFFRSKSRLLGSLGTPFFFLAIFGGGLGSIMQLPGGENYMSFITPGILAMVLMMGSMMSGIIVIMDRQFGFLKETLVAPISRLSVVIGKALGGATTAMIQGLIILAMSVLLGVPIDAALLLMLLPFMFLIAVMFVSLGIALASTMQDMHGFQIISNFLIMPLFFLSGALFPLTTAPQVIQVASMVDPLTYGVSGLRFLVLGTSEIPFVDCLLVVLVCTAIFMGLAIRQFSRIEE
jgi:ABC-2 type transport system permease protein